MAETQTGQSLPAAPAASGQRTPSAASPPGQPPPAASESGGTGASRSRLLTAVVLVNSALAVFTVGLILSLAWPQGHKSLSPRTSGAGPTSMPAGGPADPAEAEASPSEAEPASSWPTAERLFAHASFSSALQEYRRLAAARKAGGAQDGAAGDLLTLRQAQCLFRLGQAAQSQEALNSISHSGSAAIQAAAHHLLALLDAQAGAWMHARTHAYLAIAAVGWLDKAAPLETDCDFAAAEMLAREVMPLYNRDAPLPDVSSKPADLFAALDPTSLERLLEAGPAAQPGTLGAEVRKVAGTGGEAETPAAPDRAWGLQRYSATCIQVPLEEVLARFAAESGLDVKWESVPAKVRGRPVTLRLASATPQRFVEVACGAAALVARFTGKDFLVYDPASAASSDQRREFLTAEAASVWRRIFLRVPEDRRLPEAHFILGAVYECSGDHGSALAEYRLVANRFPQAPAAASALIRSAGVRMELNDYTGANQDLLDVLDSHADPALCEQAHLQLGLMAMKAGQPQEAERAFRKLYYLDVTLPAKAQAALHLGQCLYAQGQFPEAAKWLTTYFDHSRQTTGPDARDAGFLLAKSRAATSQPVEAAAAFRLALAADKDARHTTQISLEFCRFLTAQGDYTGALGIVGALEGPGLPEAQAGDVLLLHAQLLRTIGLPQRASAILRKATPPESGSPLAVQMEVELARCLAADGDLEPARAALAQVLPKMPQGPEAQDLACELAEICLRLGETRQTISLTTQLLQSSPPAALRRRACQALAAAYVLQHDYDNAALAYAAMTPREPEAPKP